MANHKNLQTVTIANGASLSDAAIVGLRGPLSIVLPSSWTTASLTFQVSVDGGETFSNLYDIYGTEYTSAAAASRAIILPIADFAGFDALKIRSGTSGSAVNQGGDRIIQIVSHPLF